MSEEPNPYSRLTAREEIAARNERDLLEKEQLRSLDVLRPWQRCVMDKILNPGEREVVFVVDDAGAAGVTWFIEYLNRGYPELAVLDLKPKSFNGMALAFTAKRFPHPGCVIIDAARTFKSARHGSYELLQECKDKRIRSPSWHGRTTRLTKAIPAIMCMTDMPDLTKLSLDRYYIVHVHNVDKDPVIYTRDTTGFPEAIFGVKRGRKRKAASVIGKCSSDTR